MNHLKNTITIIFRFIKRHGIFILNNQDQKPETVDERIGQLEVQLRTYQKTLREIYDLYDKKIEELSLIRRLGDSIRSPLDFETLCREIVEAVADEISVERLALIVISPEDPQMLIRASYDAAEDRTRYYPEDQARRFSPNHKAMEKFCASSEPLLLTEAPGSLDPLGLTPNSLISLLFLPLVARHKMVGLLSLSRSTAFPFETDDVRILTIIADQSATAMANVQLFNQLAAANEYLKESERQARQTSIYLENLFETANDVIFTLDAQGRITYVNRKVEEWGYQKDDLTNKSLKDIWADPIPESDFSEIIRIPGRKVVEAGLRNAGGERREVLLSTSHIAEETGRNSAWLVLARDITERKQLEKQLFHSEKLASIGILAAGVAHEVGNPLSAISGYTQILQSGGADADETSEYLGAIESQTNRIQKIIEALLNYSRPSTGIRSQIDVTEALPSIMSILKAQKSFNNLEIIYDLADAPRYLYIDRDHLAQIIINIALNAAQAMPGGGRLIVSAGAAGQDVVISLTDTGPGIPEEIAGRIFDPFFTTKPVGQGTGLGLAICHRIVESYNGSIDLESRPGQGTTFNLRFPGAMERT